LLASPSASAAIAAQQPCRGNIAGGGRRSRSSVFHVGCLHS